MDNDSIDNILEGLDGFVPARHSQVKLYQKTALYYKNTENKYLLYKPAGDPLPEDHSKEFHHPPLFIKEEDRINAIKELQGSFTEHLNDIVHKEDPRDIKDTLVNMVNETLQEPRAGVLGALSGTVDIVVSGFSDNPEVMKTLAFLSDSDYTTAMHAVNVMALTIGYCNFSGVSQEESSQIALMALLHDLGKTEVPPEILKSTGRLTPEEFMIMKSHPQLGANIIIADPEIPEGMEVGALEHHEKLDGSGYPNRITDISFPGRLIGIIDCYEALTGDERPYRRAKMPLETLAMLKGDVVAGKLDKEIFTTFCRSLV